LLAVIERGAMIIATLSTALLIAWNLGMMYERGRA
jgi:hypothetical protein